MDRSRILEFEILVEPRLRLASLAQSRGLSAWRAGLLGKRTDVELQRVYDPSSKPEFDNQKRLHERMEASAKTGRFIAITAMLDSKEVGYAWAAEETRKTKIGRMADKLTRRKLDVKIEEINVLPEHQGQGIGSSLLYELLSHYQDYQHPQVDVPVEMEETLAWFKKLGFGESASSPEPDHRFGIYFNPVVVQRLRAPGVDWVQKQITHHCADDAPFYRVIGEEDESIAQFAH